jgi:glycosyltransferase involved in cell wall biosynthesis
VTVSYCVTLYNKATYVAATLAAVVAEWRQTGGEVVVYDDCSTDGSPQLVEAFAAQAPVRFIRGDRNVGLVLATDRLIREAAEPYLKLVDADDLLRPGSTVHLRDALERLDADLAYGLIRSRAQAAAWSPELDAAADAVPVPDAFRHFLTRVPFNVSSALFRTAAANAVLPMPADVRIPQDLILGLRLARRGLVVATGRLIAVAPDDSGGRLSRQMARMYAEYCRIIEREFAQGGAASDAAYATRRNARRCLHYFRREAAGTLGVGERLWLAAQTIAPPWRSIAASRRALQHIEARYRRDVGRVLR